MRLHGAYGPWRIGGQVFRGRGAADGTIVITDIPIRSPAPDRFVRHAGRDRPEDLGACRGIPDQGGSRASRSAPRGRQRLRADRGQGHVPVPRRKLAASVSWDETQRRLALADILFKGGDTELKLAGELTTAADKPGRLAVAGTDAVISGAMAADPPVKVKAVEAGISGDGRCLAFDRLSLQGDGYPSP